MNEYDSEPVPGLPARLPEGEKILWQGRPKWTALALRAFYVRAVALYFFLLAGWLGVSAVADGGTIAAGLEAAARVLPGAAAALGILSALAYFAARAAMYTITDRRIVMRFGIALPMVLNIPFKLVKSADLKVYADGTGDIPIAVDAPKRQSMVVLWPHVRPWHTIEPEPMLRCVPEAARVADILARALKDVCQGAVMPVTATSRAERPESTGAIREVAA